jgi:subfamily B ATP-binding cassette protein HlyB/CyaB
LAAVSADETAEPNTAQPSAALRTPGDPGLVCLTLMLRYHQIGIDPEQIRHKLGTARLDVEHMLRAARDLGLKARARTTTFPRLAGTPLPAIAGLKDGGFVFLARADAERCLIQQPNVQRPALLKREQFEEMWNGTIVMMARRGALQNLSRRFDIGWFMGAINKYRRMFVEVLVASLFLQIFALVSPLIFQVVIDKVLVHQSMSTLDVLIVGLLAIAIFEAVLSVLRTYVFSHTTNRIDVELGARLFRHLLSLPMTYFRTRRAGDSVARVRELENIRNFLTSSALTLVIDMVFTFVFLAIMFMYSGALTWVVIASLPIYAIISAAATPLFHRRLETKFRLGAENQAFLVEAVSGVETLKAMAVEPLMQRRWEEQLAAYVAASFRVLSLSNVASNAIQLVNKVATAAILYVGARLVIAGDLSVGELVAFNILAGRVSAPILRLAQIWQDFHQARISVERLGDILNTPAEPTHGSATGGLPPIRGDVEFQNVTFRYRLDGPAILRDVSLSIPAGQFIGIVGASGSGKSTIARLVQRLYVPENGRVLVDGTDLALTDPAWLRRQLGIVLQENVLLNGTVRDNIALAEPAAPMDRIIAAAKMAGAHDFILALPEGYDTMVGERGDTLSGGQRQRVAIARALLTNPRILIFDEATSALDYESERAIQDNMASIARGRTVIVIAHRLSTVRRADRIITVEKGSIVEDGNHDELLRGRGRYATLYRMQSGLHEVQ